MIWSLKMHDCWWMMTFAGRYCTCELQLQFFVFTCITALLNRSAVLVLWTRSWSWSCELWSWSCSTGLGLGLASYGLGLVALILVLWTRSCSHHWNVLVAGKSVWSFVYTCHTPEFFEMSITLTIRRYTNVLLTLLCLQLYFEVAKF